MASKLHIGGTKRKAGWEIFNIVKTDHVDHVGNANDLSRFADNTFSAIYASHILEHFSYISDLQEVLKEWFRVLLPGGKIYLSVPDLDTLATLLVDKSLSFKDRFYVMRMLYGGQTNAYDFHMVGLNEDFLRFYLTKAGFKSITRVERFGIFNDTSNKQFLNRPISLNMTALK
ncbi:MULTISPECIES: class I SAM-dependent methyltransferase [Methylotuvimicrobium]|uniref:Methyltransferase type 11 domain-containing protein n=2 Tax=Methylotuvimicrobium TaxID=2822410 RepID=G4SXJ0_META2|nr:MULTISPECIES: methyltransferase domain-containing protein [Methylotuvimicrobium]QCW84288.1 methyltransferase domain-containing protein [Methylotuvimicrobium buryatense]CCE25358.1 protein of unknown function [Methylotuvimicrobium alcaliphilum 20Z]